MIDKEFDNRNFTYKAYIDGIFKERIGLHIFRKTNTCIEYVENMMVKTIPHDEMVYDPRPPVVLTRTEAQQLMDTLWDCGIRPTEGTGSAGSLAATERHLADMRQLVFNERKIR